jgi:hypothetical protein
MSPNAGGGGKSCGVSANEYSCTHGAQMNFGDLTLYLTYGERGQGAPKRKKRGHIYRGTAMKGDLTRWREGKTGGDRQKQKDGGGII